LLHLFQLNGDRLAFDSDSGALHHLDETADRVLRAWVDAGGCQPEASVLAQLSSELGPAAAECESEIEAAVTAGLLFSHNEPVGIQKLYPDQPRIKSMCLHLCHDCNLRCRYCFAGTGDFGTGERSMLDVATGKKAVDFLIEASGPRRNLDIDFFGGEPLMNWPVVVALTDYCEQRAAETGKDLRLTITTNAVLLDAEKTAFINQHFKNCVLSIDGRPEVHDRMRPDAGTTALTTALRPISAALSPPGANATIICAARSRGTTWIFLPMCCTWASWPVKYPLNRSFRLLAAAMKSGLKTCRCLNPNMKSWPGTWTGSTRRAKDSISSISWSILTAVLVPTNDSRAAASGPSTAP